MEPSNKINRKQCCGFTLVSVQIGFSILGQCGSGSVSGDLMNKNEKILQVEKKS
jgi:hypothetical protein